MGSSSRQYPTLLEYLAERDFLPQSQGPWFDHQAEGRLIRVVHEPDDEYQVIALAPRGVCLYKAMFTPGTPPAVIIAVIETALAQPPVVGYPERSRGRRRAGTRSPAASLQRRKTGRDDHR